MNKGIKDVVMNILVSDAKARDSDRYLYVAVIKAMNPNLAYKPLADAFADADIPCRKQ